MIIRFLDRAHAGRLLAAALDAYRGRRDVVVLALPRGGVPVAYEVATRLQVPLDVLVVRKLGAPMQPELAMGAIARGGVRVLNTALLRALAIPAADVAAVEIAERAELRRRERVYRGDRPWPRLRGRCVVIVDDGLATGATMRAAAAAAAAEHPARVIVAVPVGASKSVAALRGEVDEVVCLATPEPLAAIAVWYDRFEPTSDEEVLDLLSRARAAKSSSAASSVVGSGA